MPHFIGKFSKVLIIFLTEVCYLVYVTIFQRFFYFILDLNAVLVRLTIKQEQPHS